jgi:uncharacterized protein YdhG (YjbR/CyaY superfamily)
MKESTSPKNIDDYIAGFPEKTQLLLHQLRATIREAAPMAEEVISYQMPAYKWDGILVYFAGYNNHIGFYPGVSGIQAFINELSSYRTSKGTIQLPIDKPIPTDLIKRIVAFRLKEKMEKVSNMRNNKK